MARRKSSRTMNALRSSGWDVAKTTGRITEKAAVGLFRWAATDHTGMTKAMQEMPSMGFGDTFKYVMRQILYAVVVAVVTGVWIFVLVSFGIPFLISVILSW